MRSPPAIRRSAYADRLRAFPGLVFDAPAAATLRGGWSAFFSKRIGPAFDGTIILEIGCFDASFLSQVAGAHPQVGFIGMDWKCKALYDGARRVVGQALPNVALVHGRGQEIGALFGDAEIDEIWVFHPDPFDRPVERQMRLIDVPFLATSHALLRRGTSVIAMKTDHPGYYQWILGLLGLPQPAWFEPARTAPVRDAAWPRVRAGDLVGPDQIPPPSAALGRWFDVAVNSPDYWNDPAAQAATAGRRFAGLTTHFERRYRARHLPIYYMELHKTP